MDGLFFVRAERDALEPFQLANRPRGAARLLMNVKLRDFVG